MKKIKVENKIKLNTYSIISDEIERAIDYGYHRSFKYHVAPPEDVIKNEIHNSIMNKLSELINFD